MGELPLGKERSSCQRTEEPHKGSSQSVHSSASKPRGHTKEPNGPKASNERWSEGTQEDGNEKNTMSEENLSAMTPQKEPQQDKEALRARWTWVEHAVWTDRMLRSIETTSTRPGCTT
jgi:hypothetical protein